MQNPEVYREMANKCLQEAAQVHEVSRLMLIMQAQRWFELAEMFGLAPRTATSSNRKSPTHPPRL